MLLPLDLNEDFVYEEGITETSVFSSSFSGRNGGQTCYTINARILELR